MFALFLLASALSSKAHSGNLERNDIYHIEWAGNPIQAQQGNTGTSSQASTAVTLSAAGSDTLLVDSNEVFNRLWLKSFHPDATFYEGETAGRKLAQMWVKSLWKQFGAKEYKTANYWVEHLDRSNEYKPRHDYKNEFDYRLSVSEDDVELKLHYSFY